MENDANEQPSNDEAPLIFAASGTAATPATELLVQAGAKPPDHMYGMVVAVCVFISQCGIYGVLNSYSTFSDELTKDDSLGRPSSTDVSFGNSLANGFAPFVAVFAGALTDRLGPRIVLASAAILVSTAFFASSFATSVTVLVIAYSVPACIGSACLSTPGSAAVSSWLEKRLNIGMGIAYSGNGAGSSIIVPIAGALTSSSISWRTSFKILAAIPLMSFVAALFITFRVPPRPRKPLSADERRFLKKLLLSRAFWTLFVSAALFSFTFFSVLYVLVPFAGSYGSANSCYADYARITTSKASTLFTWLGVFKWIGSLTLGWAAHKTEARIVYAMSAGLVSFLCVVAPLCENYEQLAAVSAGIGFSFSGMFATLPAMAAKCFRGKYAGLGIGLTMFGFSIGGFSGPPVTLALKESQNGVYTLSFAVMALTTGVSGMICLAAGDGYLGHQDFADAQPALEPVEGNDDPHN